MKHVAIATVEVEYDGETVQLTAGRSYLDSDHDLVRNNPQFFAPTREDLIRSVSPGTPRTDAEKEQADRERAEREEAIRAGADDPERTESADFEHTTVTRTAPQTPQDKQRSDALRAIEANSRVTDSAAQDRLDRLVRSDITGAESEYLAAVADPAYERAFGAVLMNPQSGHQELTPDELRALQRVKRAERVRALAISTNQGADGGLAVPFALDPSIINVSGGSVSPWRELARVVQLSNSNTWQGVSSEGVTASFDPEATEVSDDSPSFDQPEVKAEKAQAFVPFSIEVGQDFASLQSQLVVLLQDAKTQLEDEKFTDGDGPSSDEPEGIVTGLVNATPPSVVEAASATALVANDLYKVQEALPPRFATRASWVTILSVLNQVRRFIDTDEPALVNDAYSTLLGQPVRQASTWAKPDSANDVVAVYGAIADAFTIVDRVGFSVELVPHLFGASRRPTGQRGLYAYWRTGGEALLQS